MAQKKQIKIPKLKGLKSGKKPTKPSPQLIRRLLRGPLFWLIAALIGVSIFGQISKTFKTKLGVSAGLRMDAVDYNSEMKNPFNQFSPRVSLSYNSTLPEELKINIEGT